MSGLFEWEKFGVDLFTARGRGVELRSGAASEVAKAVAAAIGLGRNRAIARDTDGRVLWALLSK